MIKKKKKNRRGDYSSSSHRYFLSRYTSETSLIRTSLPFFEIFTNATIVSPDTSTSSQGNHDGFSHVRMLPHYSLVVLRVFKSFLTSSTHFYSSIIPEKT